MYCCCYYYLSELIKHVTFFRYLDENHLFWTCCMSLGPCDGPDLFGVLRVHVPPQSGRQEEAADSLRVAGQRTLHRHRGRHPQMLLRLGSKDLHVRRHLLSGRLAGETGPGLKVYTNNIRFYLRWSLHHWRHSNIRLSLNPKHDGNCSATKITLSTVQL